MRWFLSKTDPETYSLDSLERDRRTVWDGVRNPQALRAIRSMKAGDKTLIYHSQSDAAIVGWAKIVSDSRPDPKDPKLAVADYEFGGRLKRPVTLKEIKESGKFPDWALVRQSRLSTMECPDDVIDWMRAEFGIKL